VIADEFLEQVKAAGAAAGQCLRQERNAGGWWEGELSASALSTAVAVLALGSREEGNPGESNRPGLIGSGLEWLARTQLADGGWGDTVRSKANVATTLLAWAAFGLGGRVLGKTPEREGFDEVVARAERWIEQEAGGLAPQALKAALGRRYGKDKTFAVPILMACAVGGRLGAAPGCWREVPALPFEMAAFPRRWFAALRLPVVSYALPALIAIGQVRHVHAPGWRPWSWLREAAVGRTRRLLREIQPEGGGFLEATPLTGFVAMALCSAGAGDGEVVREALAFLERSVREDGSWPIDTNLATWGTTLSVKALGSDLPPGDREAVREWLLGQQYKVQHPYCLSAPGGWAWTDLPGGVPDADDTAGALLALRELAGPAEVVAAEAGARWLAGLQNEDGGMPTFCKGWGALPFDRSAADLTAHALAAWQVWREDLPMDLVPAMQRAVDWIEKTQRPDGAWLPLWFGNEHETDEANAVYGTATVLKYLCRLPVAGFPRLAGMREKAAGFLTRVQQENGTWSGGPGGGAGSIEETAAAVEALVAFAGSGLETSLAQSLGRGIEAGGSALLRLTEGGKQFPAAPIGLYFARLWYYEKLYPLTASVAAFRRLQEWLAARDR
jgi:squalene-hopene/tetraprenyl-beta-curcumene cyclase